MQLLALIVGRIEFADPAAGAAWRARAIAPDRWKDRPDDGPLFAGAPAAPTVGALFAAIAPIADDDPSFLEHEDGAIAGVIAGEETILRWHASIVAALREAADAGGVGAAAILVPAIGGATKIVLTAGKKGKPGKSKLEQLPAQQLFADEALAAQVIALDGWIQGKKRSPSRTRAEHRAGEARYWLGDAPTGDEAAALAVARALDDAALAAALADPTVLGPDRQPLARAFADAAALRAGVAAATPLALVIAIELVAHADPAAATALALALAQHPSPYLARAAIRSLARSDRDAALDGIVAALDHPIEWTAATDALAASRHPGAAARVVALLADAVAGERGERAIRVVQAAASVRDAAVLRALFGAFDDPRARWMVPQLVQAIARHGGPDVDARAQELQLAMMGMGRALNSDVARRAALLGIEGEEDSGDIIRYADLPLDRLTTLLDEGFIHPEARQNDAPSTVEFFQLMTAWPELRACGYAVSPARPDYRVMIDGVAADLSGVAADRAEALRAALTAVADSASTAELDGDDVNVWWT